MNRITSSIVILVAVTLPVACATERSVPVPIGGTPPVTTSPAATAAAARALEQGRAHIARGDMAAGAVALREALHLRPDLAEARASLGLALYAMGDLDGAVDELRGLLRVRPDFNEARLTLAGALVARQDWPAARAELERALAAQPDLIQAHYTLGVVRYAQGDLAGAIDAYRRVLSREPRAQDARYNLALVLKLARRDAEATPEFLAAAEAGLPRAILGVEEACGLPGGDRVELLKKVRQLAGKLADEHTRVVLGLHPQLAPIKAAVFPLKKNEPPLVELARRIKRELQPSLRVVYDDTAGIGKLYRRQDEIGTPYCLTVDFQSLADQTVTVRDRDTMRQERVAVDQLEAYLLQRLK